MRKFRKLIIVLSPILCFLIIWGISLAKCEILTQIHANEFTEAYKENTMLGDIEYAKVLNYSQNYSRVYYVSKGLVSANILTFTKENGEWKQDSWDTIWSISGSADDTTWPYWWHFFYSHPQLN